MMKNQLMTFFLLVLCLPLANAQQDSLLSAIDIPPLFEGCDDPLISEKQRQDCSNPKIQAFINQNIVYPDSARINNVEGVVVVRFLVNKEGKIDSVELVRNIGAGCGIEALRVVKLMPDSKPALRNGEAVATKITLPIRFKKINEAKANNKNLYQIHWGTAYANVISKENLAELISQPLVIRDYYGNLYDVNSLVLKIKSKNKENTFESKGNFLSPQMLKALRRPGNVRKITFAATINKGFQEIKIVRELIVKP